jgi:membrane protein YqaA with SNARE-associated domain
VDVLLYILVFIAALAVDLIPFFGPPAWTVMVFLQMRYGLDIWPVLIVGVVGSAIGRYLYSLYIPYFSSRLLKQQKNEDMMYIGSRLNENNWKVQVFVLLYTVLPLPSTPLFTAAGISRINTLAIIPAFLVGKFIIDTIMVHAGNYIVSNTTEIAAGLVSWQNIVGTIAGILVVLLFLFVDWRRLLQEKKLMLNFNIWK